MMDWKTIVSIAAVVSAAGILVKNTVVVARFITFLSGLKADIARIAHNSDEAVRLATEAKAAALAAKEISTQQGRTLAELVRMTEGQNRVLEKIPKQE